MEKEILVRLMSELGFPILITIVSIYLFFLTLKYILNEVKTLIDKIVDVIKQIDKKIEYSEIIISELDYVTSSGLGVKNDLTDIIKLTNKEVLRKQRKYNDY